jgi:mannose-6-phosphate isomerase-like protein (cupin superfamily)
MSAAAVAAYVLQPGEGRLIDLSGFSMSVKATAEETDGSFTLLEATEPPHFGPPLHIHHGIAEAFYVLEGEYIIFIDAEEFAARRGRSSSSPPRPPTASWWATWRAGNSTSTFPHRWSATSMT